MSSSSSCSSSRMIKPSSSGRICSQLQLLHSFLLHLQEEPVFCTRRCGQIRCFMLYYLFAISPFLTTKPSSLVNCFSAQLDYCLGYTHFSTFIFLLVPIRMMQIYSLENPVYLLTVDLATQLAAPPTASQYLARQVKQVLILSSTNSCSSSSRSPYLNIDTCLYTALLKLDRLLMNDYRHEAVFGRVENVYRLDTSKQYDCGVSGTCRLSEMIEGSFCNINTREFIVMST